MPFVLTPPIRRVSMKTVFNAVYALISILLLPILALSTILAVLFFSGIISGENDFLKHFFVAASAMTLSGFVFLFYKPKFELPIKEQVVIQERFPKFVKLLGKLLNVIASIVYEVKMDLFKKYQKMTVFIRILVGEFAAAVLYVDIVVLKQIYDREALQMSASLGAAFFFTAVILCLINSVIDVRKATTSA